MQNVVLALTIAAVIVWGPIATSRLIHYIDFFRQSGRVVEAFKHAAFAQDRRVGMEPEGKRASE